MEVFFYGLFMDKDILIKNGISPSNPRKGYLNNYTLKIGNRASLIQCEKEKAYGIIMTVGDEEIIKLYKIKRFLVETPVYFFHPLHTINPNKREVDCPLFYAPKI